MKPMLADQIAGLVADKLESIPEDIRSKSRLHVADGFANAHAAFKTEVALQALAAAKVGGASGGCTVFGQPDGLPAVSAAFVNSAFMHAADFDDIHDVARIHPTSVTLPAALAAAELVGASDDEFFDAVTLGNEAMCRLGMFVKPVGSGPGAYWLLSQLFGYFGASIAASAVMKLSKEQIVSALSLAYMQAAGGKEIALGIGGTSRGIYTGFAAQGGLQAALLARAGVKGAASVLDGKAGLLSLYLGLHPSEDELAPLLDPEPWVWRDTAIKPWPCCRSSHPYVSVSLAVSDRVGDALPKRAVVAINARSGLLCYPAKERRRPATLADAKYSVPFMVAFALVKGRVDLLNLDESALEDRQVLAMADRVEVEETLKDAPGPAPAEIRLEMEDGTTAEAKLSGAMRLEPEQVREKFATCLTFADRSELADPLWRYVQEAKGRPVAGLAELLRGESGAPSSHEGSR